MRFQLFSVASASTIMIATSSLPSVVGDDATGDDEVEDGLLELARASGTRPTGRRCSADADARRDRAVERQTRDLGRRDAALIASAS